MKPAPLAPGVIGHWLTQGFVVLPRWLDPTSLGPALQEAATAFASAHSRGAGVRDPLRWPALRALARGESTLFLAHSLLGPDAFITRAILFDKSPTANWDVAWHQDTTIAVAHRLDTPGFGPWSVKAGIPHVQPPAEVLAGVATIRIHLDPCGPENGALLVVPGSHQHGILDTVDAAACDRQAVCGAVEAGGVVAMRPLLLHASRKAVTPSHRRVLHLEFAAGPLPGGLQWARA